MSSIIQLDNKHVSGNHATNEALDARLVETNGQITAGIVAVTAAYIAADITVSSAVVLVLSMTAAC